MKKVINFTQDATKTLPTIGKASAIYVAGSVDGGTATLGYQASTGFVSLKDDAGADIVLVSGEQQTIYHGFGITLQVQLVGSTSPTLEIQVGNLE